MLIGNLTTRELVACGYDEFKNERFASALTFFVTASKNEDFEFRHLAALGRTYAKLGLFDEAKSAFSQFLEDNPEAYIERFQLGLVYRDLDDDNAAIVEFDRVIAQEATFPPALYYKALSCLNKDDQSTAIFLLNELLANTEKDNLYVKLTLELAEEAQLQLNSMDTTSSQ